MYTHNFCFPSITNVSIRIVKQIRKWLSIAQDHLKTEEQKYQHNGAAVFDSILYMVTVILLYLVAKIP